MFIKLGRGHWGLRDKYKNATMFEYTKTEYQKSLHPVEFKDVVDDMVIGEDGKQLLSIEEAKSRKSHYRYEGRLKRSQIKK